eukprot:scaffold1773_cov164-Pinguiococcus_pyrenoidosus.AAC.1
MGQWCVMMCTTQYAQQEGHQQLQRHIKPRFPFLNVRRLRCDVYTDTFFASQMGIHGYTCAQMFYGSDGHISVYPMKRKNQFYQALQQFISDHGAPRRLISDGAKEVQRLSLASCAKEAREVPKAHAMKPKSFRSKLCSLDVLPTGSGV